jgi:flagellar motor switch protein FliG
MRGKSIASAEELTGPEKAAVVMLALGKDASQPLWRSFDEDEMREVTLAITTLGAVNAEVVEELLFEFVGRLSNAGPITGSVDSARRLLQSVLPDDKVASILDDVRGPAGKTMWDKLANVNERVLSGYLKNEHPQTIAVILSRIKPEQAARVLGAIPDMLAEEVVNRLLTLGPVQKEVLDQIEKTLRTEFIATLSRGEDRDPSEAVAEIFNRLDRSIERRIMSALERKNPSAAARVKSLMFVFDDLIRLDSKDMQVLLRHIDKSAMAIALKGAAEDVRAHFFASMSERAATILKDDIDIMGPLRLREIEAAQARLVETAKALAEEGEIYLSKTPDEEVVY